MPNPNYRRGADKERKLVNEARRKGMIAARSAGSHSPIDVWIIDYKRRRIEVIQAKSTLGLKGDIEPTLKSRLERQYAFLNGTYKVVFKAL